MHLESEREVVGQVLSAKNVVGREEVLPLSFFKVKGPVAWSARFQSPVLFLLQIQRFCPCSAPSTY